MLQAIGLDFNLHDVCVFIPVLCAGLITLVTFKLTVEVKDETAGLFAAGLVSVVPGLIARTTAGVYENEGLGLVSACCNPVSG